MRNKLKFLLCACMIVLSCGKQSSEPKPTPPITTKATLLLPLKDEVCTTGALVSLTTSSVTFKWNASEFVENYTLVLKNLLTNEIINKTTADTQLAITINRNTPFSWFIKTKSNKSSEVPDSEVWKFYNAGFSSSSYAPYPADLISPTMGQGVRTSNLKVDLAWTGSDVDHDIISYDIYFGTNANPPLIKSNNVPRYYQATVSSGNKYYWKIITRDSNGNTSESGIYDFLAL